MTFWAQVGIGAGALLVSAAGGWLLTLWTLRLVDRWGLGRVEQAGDSLRGGTWIGVLERIAVTGCLLVGQPAGIAVVVAVKGLGRYPELRNENNVGVSERFVIGTLTSLIWSGALGLIGHWLLTR